MSIREICQKLACDCTADSIIRFLCEKNFSTLQNKKPLNLNLTAKDRANCGLNDSFSRFSEPGIAGYIELDDGTSLPVFCVRLTDGSLNERSCRKLQFDYAKHLLPFVSSNWDIYNLPSPCSNGIFVFADNQKHFRMSLIEGVEKEKNRVRYRRYTFYVDPEATNRTFIERMAMDWSTFDNIKEAFSVERLSDEFFEKYKAHYADFVAFATGKRMKEVKNKWLEVDDEHEKRKEDIMSQFAKFGNADKAFRDYVKKMMGRLVFLQFLAKKGWLGVPEGEAWGKGDRKYLQNLFNSKSKEIQDNFLEKVLEPLFFDTLNTDRTAENDLAAEVLSLESEERIRIPYLNGGLFEKDALDGTEVNFLARYFNDLFETFERFNFTIDENQDPADAEIGVDPEMLGRVFENLLEDNKDKGAFYTPKKIVRYMCRESLIQYLGDTEEIRKFVTELDSETIPSDQKKLLAEAIPSDQKKPLIEKLKAVKICDPAIGSGAFPMGMLNLLLLLRINLGNVDDSSEGILKAKKEIIQNNIYGVDIEAGAVDIARLRFWLSIVVDETEPTPLPNFDYKIMQGNSLLEQYHGVDLKLDLRPTDKKGKKINTALVDRQMCFAWDDEVKALENLKSAMDDFFDPAPGENKIAIRNNIDLAVKNYIKTKCGNDPQVDADIDAMDLNNKPFFLWHLYFADVFAQGGFDIVIGNPPYIKEYTNVNAFDGFRDSKYYQGKMDLWYGFACTCLDKLKDNGCLCFIATNNWTASDAASVLRKKIMSDCKIRQLLDFNSYMIFGDSASIQTMIMLFEKDAVSKTYTFDYRKLMKVKATSRDAFDFLGKALKDATYLTPAINRKKMLNSTFVFTEDENAGILNKLVAKKNFIIAKTEISQGIIGGPDEAFKVAALDTVNWQPNEKSLLHRFYTSTEKWTTLLSHSKKDIIYVTKKTVDNANDYPNVIRHLSRWRNELDNRREVISGTKRWFDLWWPREQTLFEVGPKIVFAARTLSSNFMYSEEEFYASRNNFILKTDRCDLKYLVGVLNSKLILFFMINTLKHVGELLQIDKNQFVRIPIFVPCASKQQAISQIVSAIIDRKIADPSAVVQEEERQIDTLVYQLYDLTSDEIAVVENSFKKTENAPAAVDTVSQVKKTEEDDDDGSERS